MKAIKSNIDYIVLVTILVALIGTIIYDAIHYGMHNPF
jgi:hypothetical protein